jgi:D-beta-D-heptose 7-phosphate kinase/D-beta-D-heptose 1-phosphate adenosyltransferase
MKIGLIGDHISDIYIYGKMNRFSPESPIPIFDIIKEESRAGGASNVNNNLINLGAHVDYYYDALDYSVKKRYVCDNHIMFRVDEDKTSTADISQIQFPEETKYVILSDYNKGILSKSQQLVHSLKEQGKIVIVDPKKSLVNYESADIVKLNESEYHRFSMIEGGYQDTRKFYNIGTLVITKGGEGVTIVSEDGIQNIPGHSTQVSDVTGAGDVFIAAMTYYLAKGKSIYNACELANKLAALSVCKFGTYTLTPEDVRSVEKKVVFTNGCFDFIHRGHVTYLEKSKELGDYLIVGLNSDDSVKRLKGENKPYNNQDDRKKVLESLKCVDEVIIFDEDTPYDLIKRIQPDIITKGGDYKTKEEVVGNDIANVELIPFLEGYSTTKMVEKINDC